MKLKVYWISVLVIIFVFIVVKNIPAQWGLWLANAPIQMSGISGTLWQGKAASAVVPLQNNTSFALGEVQWNLSPWSLLTASPCADLKTKLDDQQISGIACAGLSGDVQLENAQIAVPAKVAEVFAPIVEIQGDILLHVENLNFSNNRIEKLSGSGSWNGARFYNSTSWVGLGTLGFEFGEDGQGGVNAKVFDVEGPLQLQLNSQFDLVGGYNTQGEVSLRPNAPTEIADLLNNYTNVSREVQEVLSLFVERKGRDQYSVRWVNPQ